MRTAVLYGKEDIRIEDRPVPEPGPGQMLVKIDYVGICGTDIEFYKLGQTPTPLPKILGHENSGTIVKLGEGVTISRSASVCYADRLRTAKKTALHVRKAKQTSVSTDFRELPVSECRMAVTQNIC